MKLGIWLEYIEFVLFEEGYCIGIVEVVEYLGVDIFFYVVFDGFDIIFVWISGVDKVDEGFWIGLKFDELRMYFFDVDG